jgi:hypothetical protein
MNTTRKTQRLLVVAVLGAALGTGLGGCAADVETAGLAERGSSDLAHEVTRAENRLRADRIPTTGTHTDEITQRQANDAHEVTRAENRLRADRAPVTTSNVNDNDPRSLH